MRNTSRIASRMRHLTHGYFHVLKVARNDENWGKKGEAATDHGREAGPKSGLEKSVDPRDKEDGLNRLG